MLDRGERLCAIVTIDPAGHDAVELVRALRDEAINTSASPREYAVIDMDAKHARNALRISPHYYNTQREIDIALDAIEGLIG